MKTLYLDLVSGISGDMLVGALLDLGVDLAELERQLSGLGLEGFHVHASRGQKAGITGTKFDVHLEEDHHHHDDHDHHHHEDDHGHHHHHDDHQHGHHHHDHHHHDHEHDHGHHHPHDDHEHHHPHGDEEHHHSGHEHLHEESRDFAAIKALIAASKLSDWVKGKSVAVFQRLAEAEGKVHGLPPDQVHFHEVGAVDSIVDIVGGCIALELLGRPRVLASAVTEGTGMVRCAHGRYPLPAPATLGVLAARCVPITQCAEPNELVTPTGAALLAEFAESFGPMRGLAVARVGHGLGTRDNQTRPNVLRALLAGDGGALAAETNDWDTDTVAVLETNLDDVSSEILGHFVEGALAAGALDVFHTPIQMKKSRPGVLLTVLCAEADADRFTERLLRETSALGVRRTVADRRKLRRDFREVATAFGEVIVKLGLLNGRVVQVAPEFESCRRTADRANAPLKEVYEAALQAARTKLAL